ncbi:hypothetical protein SAMN05920897_10221 [Alkalispirochaeta americana]|uniref:Lon N-terminal domain-containing protein n=1 Tax=Alkalispirochaeta americana TaxID=159291 RepID=A0A1N6NXH4_9SPIO|nr:LON peptidase substrate-binding domain-containing protein [Alkalispirochaeta americana]SIP96753.1 hypothetical protein SAMN05920897_10221 [Alkalispirochaeta americana]
MKPGKRQPKLWKNLPFDSFRKGQYFTGVMRVPVFPLGVVLLPRMPLPLHIFEERYQLMINRCLEEAHPFGVLFHTGSSILKIGCLAQIESVINRYNDGGMDLLAAGTERFSVSRFHDDKPYLEAEVAIFHDEPPEPRNEAEEISAAQRAIHHLEQFARAVGYDIDRTILNNLDHEELSFLLATTDIFSTEEKQRLLESRSTLERMEEASRALQTSCQRRLMEHRIRKILNKTDTEDLTNLFN